MNSVDMKILDYEHSRRRMLNKWIIIIVNYKNSTNMIRDPGSARFGQGLVQFSSINSPLNNALI